MHTLFTLEDIYGLTISEADGEICLKVNKGKGKEACEPLKTLHAWKEHILGRQQLRQRMVCR